MMAYKKVRRFEVMKGNSCFERKILFLFILPAIYLRQTIQIRQTVLMLSSEKPVQVIVRILAYFTFIFDLNKKGYILNT